MSQSAPVSEFPLDRIHAAYRQARMLIASMGSSLIAYVIIAEIIRRTQPDATPIASGDMLRIILFAVAGTAIFTATVVKAILLRNAPATPEARLARLRNTALLSAAFAELPAVLGFVLFFTTRRHGDFYALLVVSAYMLVRHFPRLETWENYVRRGNDAR